MAILTLIVKIAGGLWRAAEIVSQLLGRFSKTAVLIVGVFLGVLLAGLVASGAVCCSESFWLVAELGKMPSLRTRILRGALLSGTSGYSWQWPGENWLGNFFFTETAGSRIEAEVEVRRICSPDVGLGKGPIVLKNLPGSKGEVILYHDRVQIRNLVVTKTEFDGLGCHARAKYSFNQTLSADLHPARAFAGSVFWGDMTLRSGLNLIDNVHLR